MLGAAEETRVLVFLHGCRPLHLGGRLTRVRKEGERQQAVMNTCSLFPSFCLTPSLFCPIRSPKGTLARTSKQPLYIHSPCVGLQSLCPYVGPLSPLHVFEALRLSLSATVESSASFLSGWESSFILKISNQPHFYRKMVKYFLRFSRKPASVFMNQNISLHRLTEKKTFFHLKCKQR